MPTKNSVRTLEVNRVVSTLMTIFKSFFGGKREVDFTLKKTIIFRKILYSNTDRKK